MEKEVPEKMIIGSFGETQVNVALQGIGWAPAVKIEQDIGDDLLSFARITVPQTEETNGSTTGTDVFDIGMPVILQVKSSATEYLKPTSKHNKKRGWWYWEGSKGHFDHWTTCGLPYLLVLQDTKNHISYWAHVRPEAITKTAGGRKVFVPFDQTIDSDNVDVLTRAVLSHRETLMSGPKTGRVKSLAPGQRLRYALIVPRLAAPHPNSLPKSLESEEAVALILLGRRFDIHYIAGRGGCPEAQKWGSHKEWGWRFARAFVTALETGDTAPLTRLSKHAPSRPERDACLAVLACVAFAQGRDQDALDALTPDRTSRPVDRAWLLTLRAHVLFERGDSTASNATASKAVTNLKASSDLTSEVLRGAAMGLVYSTAITIPANLFDTLNAQDNLGTLWREQAISVALAQDLDNRFQDWAGDKSIRFVSTTPFIQLTYAGWNGAFSGAWGSWRDLSTQAARVSLASSADPADVTVALKTLVTAGNKKLTGLAARRTWLNGPLESLVETVAHFAICSWSLRAEGAILDLFSEAGDLLPSTTADATIERIIGLLYTGGTIRRLGHGASDRISEVDTALRRILSSATSVGHRLCADLVCEFFPKDYGDADSMLRLAQALRVRDLGPEALDRLVTAAKARTDFHRAALLEVVGCAHEPAIEALRALRDAGDTSAARALLVTGQTEASNWAALGRTTLPAVQKMVSDATPSENGSVAFSGGSFDHLNDLALAAFHTGNIRHWKAVTDALSAGVLPGISVAKTIEFLASNFTKLPVPVQTRLQEIAPKLRPAVLPTIETGSFASAKLALLAVTGHLKGAEATGALMILKTIDPAEFARVLQDMATPHREAFLLVSLVDSDPEVRSQAAYSLIRFSCGRRAVAERAAAALLVALDLNRGARMPFVAAAAIKQFEAGSAFDPVRERLSQHSSASVRAQVTE